MKNEINLSGFLRSHLNLHEKIIRDRFGPVEYLFDKDFHKILLKVKPIVICFSTISIPELKEIQTIDFSSFKDEK
jgi:hypothetical protein